MSLFQADVFYECVLFPSWSLDRLNTVMVYLELFNFKLARKMFFSKYVNYSSYFVSKHCDCYYFVFIF